MDTVLVRKQVHSMLVGKEDVVRIWQVTLLKKLRLSLESPVDNVSDFRLYRQKQATDEEFVEFCRLRRGAAKHTLDALLLLPVSPVHIAHSYITTSY